MKAVNITSLFYIGRKSKLSQTASADIQSGAALSPLKIASRVAMVAAGLMLGNSALAAGKCGANDHCSCQLASGGGIRVILDTGSTRTDPRFYVGRGASPDTGLFHANMMPSSSLGTEYYYDDTDHSYSGNTLHYNIFASSTWYPGSTSANYQYTAYSSMPTCASFDNQAPTASLAIPSCTAANGSCTLDGSGSSDSDGTIATYAFDCDNNGTNEYSGTSSSYSCSYTTVGSRTAKLTVTDDDAATNSTTQTVTITKVAPTVAFSSNCVYLRCAFDATVTDDDISNVTYSWNISGGTYATDYSYTSQDPVFNFSTGGDYSVSVTVTDVDLQTDTESKFTGTIAANVAPTADFTVTCAQKTCTFVNNSSDSDGSIAGSFWNFGDSIGTSTLTSPTYVYATAGSYSVSLTVTDSEGLSHTATKLAAPANNVSPTASFTVSCTGRACSVDASASSDSDGTVDQYAWNWGDGTQTTGYTSSRTYAADGTYSISLTVTDNSFGTGSTSKDVTVKAIVTDIIRSSYDVGTGKVIHAMTFANLQTQAPKIYVKKNSNGNHIANVDMTNSGDGYTWTYTDLTTYVETPAADVIHVQMWSNTQSKWFPGPTSSDFTAWTYQTIPPNQAPTATATVAANPCASSGTTCSFTGSGSDSDGTIASYSWDFGDGSSSSTQNPTHAYATNGDFSVTLTVTDNGGKSATSSLTVTVAGPTPTPTPYPNFAYTPGNDSMSFRVNNTACGSGVVNYGVNQASTANSQNMYSTPATNQGNHQEFVLNGLTGGDVVNFNFDLGSCSDSGALSYTVPSVVALYPSLNTNSERYVPNYQYTDTNGCLVSNYGDRVHFRHAKSLNEMNYYAIETSYWLKRSAEIKFTDCTTASPSQSLLIVEVKAAGQLLGKEFRNFYQGSEGKLEKWENTMPDNGYDPDPSYGTQTNQESNTPEVQVRRYTLTKHPTANNRNLVVGDTMEFEANYDLSGNQNPGREVYYLSQNLYKLGTGIVPWTMKDRLPGADNTLFTSDDTFTTVFDTDGTWNGFSGNNQFIRNGQGQFPTNVEVEWDSTEITNSVALVAGEMTMNEMWSGEDNQAFKQFAPNMSGENVRPWLRGRRIFHTSFRNSSHHEHTFSGQEDSSNGNFPWADGKIPAQYINDSCADCHKNNGAAPVPKVGQPIDRYVIRLDNHAMVGNALQPTKINRNGTGGSIVRIDVRDDPDVAANFEGWTVPQAIASDEGSVSIKSIDTVESVSLSGQSAVDLKKFTYQFANSLLQQEYTAGELPMSVRRTPRLVGMGLKDAVTEADILYNEANQPAGLSGRIRTVVDPETSDVRIGRFGYKGGEASLRHQIAQALRTDMGMPNHIYSSADCGDLQTSCAPSGDRFVYDITSTDGINPYDTPTDDNRGGQPAASIATGGYGNGSADSNRTTYGNSNEANYFEDLTRYVSLLAPPPTRVDGFHVRTAAGNPGPSDFVTAANIADGRDLFFQVGCGDCHRAGPGTSTHYTTTANHPYAELRGEKYIAYTDFLLHNMGPGLADTLDEGNPASGGAAADEWMTPSLLGVGYQKCVTGDFGRWLTANEWVETPPPQQSGVSNYASNYCVPSEGYLHDGRASTLEEAILWHGGEGEVSKNAWKALTKTERDKVVSFLKSL